MMEEYKQMIRDLVEALENSDVSNGVCCCGDSMNAHSDPMFCGHMPVDSGEYYTGQLIERAKTLIEEK